MSAILQEGQIFLSHFAILNKYWPFFNKFGTFLHKDKGQNYFVKIANFGHIFTIFGHFPNLSIFDQIFAIFV